MQGPVEINKSSLFHLSMITLLGMPAIGFIIINLAHDSSIVETLFDRIVPNQIVGVFGGLLFGAIAAVLGIILITRPNMDTVNDFFSKLIQQINPGIHEILFYSFCAGVGEEILFRGAIQPLIGIWPASIIFVLLHGYINFNNFNTTIYGVFLVVVSAGFGYLDNAFGILAPIAAHFLYDVIMFLHLKKSKPKLLTPKQNELSEIESTQD